MFAPEGDGCLQRAKREDAGRFSKEGKSLDDFCRAFGHSKARERKSFFNVKDNTSSTAIAVPLLPLEKALYPLFLLQNQAQKKKLSKRKRRNWAFALCGARQELRVPPSRRRRHTCFAYVSIPRLRKPPQRLDLNFNGKMRAKTLMGWRKLYYGEKNY